MLKKRGFFLLVMISIIYWGYFFIERVKFDDESGRGVAADTRAAGLKALEAQIEVFGIIEKRYPATLEELVEEGYLESIPASGAVPWKYDPEEGVIK